MKKSDNRTCFIFNVTARQGRSVKLLDWLRNEAEKRWDNYEIVVSGEDGHIPDHESYNFSNFDLIIACGGDGTAHHAAKLALKYNSALGVLPVGSGNDFAKALNMPTDNTSCLNILAEGNIKKVDLIWCGGDVESWCINTLGIGFDGLTNRYTSFYKRYFGAFGYYLGALHTTLVFGGREMEFRTAAETLNENLLMVTACNGQVEGGSFQVAPNAKIDDGLIDVLIIKPVFLPKLWYYLPKFKKRLPREMNEIKELRCKKFSVKSEKPLSVHADGEQLGNDVRSLDVLIHEKILKVVIP